MKSGKPLLVLVAALIPLAPLCAQDYAIDWYRIDGGGGTSSGGIYSISGTIAQPDAGVLTSINYSLLGGFWSIIEASYLANQVVALGAEATFFISPNGQEPFSYQWQFNGTDLVGQTNASLVVANVQPGNAGIYCVVVVDGNNLTNTYCATLNALHPPSITTPPFGQTVSVGVAVTLSVVVAGDGPFQYQWRLNGVHLPGATNATYSITNAQPSQQGSYSVAVANTVGAVISAEALVKVLSVALPFADNFADAGGTNSLSGVGSGNNVHATREHDEPYHAGKFGSNSVWLRWTAPASGVATFDTRGSSFDTLLGIYTGTNVSQLTEVASDDDSGGFFTSKVLFNAHAGATYNIAVDGLLGATGDIVLSWTLNPAIPPIPHISSQPVDVSVQQGSPATFNVVADANTSLTYQWHFNDVVLGGATNSSLTVSNVGPANVGYYSVQVTDVDGQSVESLAAALEIGPVAGAHSYDKLEDLLAQAFGLSTDIRPQDLSAFPSVSVGSLGSQLINNFNATSERGEPIHAQTIGGSTRWFLLRAVHQGTFIIDTLGSGVATLLSVYTGSNILSLQVVAEDHNRGPDGIHSKVRFESVAGTSYLIAVSGVNGVQGDININWRLGIAPAAAVVGVNEVLIQGASLVLQSGQTNANPAPTYQWLFNGRKIAGATNATYSLVNVQIGQQGTYSVVVSNFAGVVTEVVAVVTIETQSFQLVADLTLGSLNFRVIGGPTQAVVLQLSTNLTSWTPLFTNLAHMPLSYLDTNWAARGRGYYRFKFLP